MNSSMGIDEFLAGVTAKPRRPADPQPGIAVDEDFICREAGDLDGEEELPF